MSEYNSLREDIAGGARLTAGLAMVLCLLAGCGGGRSSRTDDGRIPVRVYLLLISTQQVEYYAWAEEAYEARHPGVDVIIEQFPGSSLKDFEIKLRLRFSSGQAPDVIHAAQNVAAELAALGLLAEAPPFIERMVKEKGRTAVIRSAPYSRGTCYGIVSDVVPTALYYNKDMFRAAGLDPDRPPRTWKELIEYAERLTVRDASGRVVRAGLSLRKRGFKPGTTGKWFTFLFSAGGQAFSADGERARFNSPAGRAALGLYRTILFDKKLDSITLEGDQRGFGQGTVAMFIREYHVVRWLHEHYPDLDFGVAPIPRRDTSLSASGTYLWVVSGQSPHPEASWRFVQFLMSDSTYARYASIGGVVPVTKAVAALPAFREDPYLRVFLEQPVKMAGGFPLAARAKNILGAYIERFCYGRMGVEETLRRAAHDVNALLRYNDRYERTY